MDAELAQMPIVIAVTVDAVGWCMAPAPRGLTMALRAADPAMRTGEHESGLPVVIELPDGPTIRGMAALTLCAEPTVVYVLRAVAAVARGGRADEGHAPMALRAAQHSVQAQKRKGRQIVVKV